MEHIEIIILLYIFFIWSVMLHTFDEIAQGIFMIRFRRIQLTMKKYLIGASIITTINLGTLSLIVYGSKTGLYLGIFTSVIFGILQVIVHTAGFISERGRPRKLGAGFYSSIPLSVVAAILLYHIITELS